MTNNDDRLAAIKAELQAELDEAYSNYLDVEHDATGLTYDVGVAEGEQRGLQRALTIINEATPQSKLLDALDDRFRELHDQHIDALAQDDHTTAALLKAELQGIRYAHDHLVEAFYPPQD